jgi:hypothetical protein
MRVLVRVLVDVNAISIPTGYKLQVTRNVMVAAEPEALRVDMLTLVAFRGSMIGSRHGS